MNTPRLGAPEVATSSTTPGEDCTELGRYIEQGANHFSIKDRDLAAPPGSPADGDCYIVAASPTGFWSGHSGDIAFYLNTAWAFIDVKEGMTFWIEDEDRFLLATSSSTFQEFLAATLSWKQAVRAATTTNGTLATAFANGQSVDGVTLATGDRILLKNQTTGSENGIYTVNASGAPTRASDADSGAKLVNATVKVSEGTTNADTEWQCTTNATITLGSTALTWAQFGAAGAGYSGGVQSTPILAGAMTPRTTSGPATGSSESSTNKIMRSTLDFDGTSNEYAQFIIPMPKSWNESTVTAQFIWEAPGGTGNVVWGIQGVALSDDDVIDAAFGTAQTVTDGVTATTDVMQSAFTSAITIGGTPAEGDLVVFQVYRDAANGSDTLNAIDAKLIAIRLNFTTNASDDS
jgi:hypothetical protein